MVTHECLKCYAEFEERTDQPSLRVCMECVKTPNHIAEWECPNCGWDSSHCVQDETAPCKYSEFEPDYEYGYCGGQHWTEEWTCPVCGDVFEFRNSSV